VTRTGGRRAARRRADVLAAAGAVVAERGADATRFTDVTAATGVGVSTLQYYFGSREDMLIAAFRHAAAADTELLRAAAGLGDPWERLCRICAIALGAADAAAPYAWRLRAEGWRWAQRDPAWRAEFLADAELWRGIAAEAVAAGVAAGRFRADADPRQVALQALAMSGGIGMSTALRDPAVDTQFARDLVTGTLARLLLPDRPADAPADAAAEPASVSDS
jgi:AcrR family transcriptional regulator